jgi:hypothetical protein
MVRRRRLNRAVRGAVVGLLSIVLVGCSGVTSRGDLWLQHIGIRPDEPPIAVEQTAVCAEYAHYATYAQQLQEAYHSRATHNRWWIYAAGILGLGAAAASGGLAIAGATATTIALLSVSGGFSAGAFATIDNPELARLYTASSNQIDTALKESDGLLAIGTDGKRNATSGCGPALRTLKDGVSEARTTLELGRTNSAVGALVRAKAERDALDKLIAGAQGPDPTRVSRSATITTINPASLTAAGSRGVALTVENIDLDKVAMNDVKVVLGAVDRRFDVDSVTKSKDFTYSVQFKAPDGRPDPAKMDYEVTLLVGKSGRAVRGAILKYP